MEYEKLAARFSDDGVYGTPADTAVVSAGVGLSVTVRADVYASVRGHAWTSGTSGDTLAVTANASGQTRVDRVVLRLDRSTWDVRAAVKQGTPGSGVPSLSQSTGDTGTYEIPLAEVTVLSGAGSVTVVRKELYVGSRVRPATSTTRNPLPVPGELAFETNTGITRQWDGSAWSVVHSNSGVVNVDSPLSAWAVETNPVIEERGGNVHFRLGSFERKAGNLSAGTDSRLPVLIPSTYRHPSHHYFGLFYISGSAVGRCTIYPANSSKAGQVWLTQHGTVPTGQLILGTSTSWVVS
nr:hypothetical protein [Streptomyces sp. TRM68416]